MAVQSLSNHVLECSSTGSIGLLSFDGACRGNPGDSGAGACIQTSAGIFLWHGWHYLGHATSNQAEYHGLIIGLTAALERGYTNLIVNGDSELIIGQMQHELQQF